MNMIKYLFHLSDIHIRNGDLNYSRFNEYKKVFENLFKSMKNYNYNKDEFLIIITGDIFHNKNNIGNYGLMLYKILIENLTKIGKTIILEGNHDSVQHELNQPSLVTSTFEIDNLIVLRETRSFVIDDIGFSYVNIRDTLDNLSSFGRKTKLEPFPIITDNVKYKVALFHGTFANIKLYNGTSTTNDHNPYPFEWIENFDFALLGDIHLRQKNYYKNKLLWCYSGSLIQQNFGEDIIDHGYVIWDLNNKKINYVNVYNEIGKIVLKEIDNKIFFRKTNNFHELQPYIEDNISFFPKKLEIKFQSNYDDNNLNKILHGFDITYKVISNYNHIDKTNFSTNIANNNISIDSDNLLLYFKEHLDYKQYQLLYEIVNDNHKLMFDTNNYPKELHDECNKKNKELTTIINTCIKSKEEKNIQINFNIDYLEWSNLYCYDNVNWINFTDLSSSTFIISGKNGTGKSAIYDILVLAIWGNITVDKQNDISSGIINFNYDIAYTTIILNKNNNKYKIVREYTRKKDNNYTIKIITKLYENNVLIKKDSAAKEYINNLFGTINNFLSSSMITQNIDNNILKMNYKDSVELIDNATNIDYIHNLYNLFKNSLNKYKDFNKIVTAKKNVFYNFINDNNINNEIIQNINETKLKLNKLMDEKNKLTNEIVFVNNIVNFDANIDYEYEINKLKQINITSQLSYENILNLFNEIKYFFKKNNINNNDIIKYAKLYNENILYDENQDYSIIDYEYNYLKDYFNFKDILNESTLNLKKKISFNNDELNKLKDNLSYHNSIKPIIQNKFNFNYNLITKYFENVTIFISFYNNNEKYCFNDLINYNKDFTYKSFLLNKKKICSLDDRIKLNKNKLDEVEKQINQNILLLNNCNNIDKPVKNIRFKSSKSIAKYIESNFKNIESIISFNENNKLHYDNYLELNKLKEEFTFYDNEIYEYNKDCYCCQKRPWVIEINKIKIKIDYLTNLIDKNIIKTYIKNTNIIEKYELTNIWYKFYYLNEIKNNLSLNLKTKETYIKLIDNDTNYINNLIDENKDFLNFTYNLYIKYKEYNDYLKYNDWLTELNLINDKIVILNDKNILFGEHMNYYTNIKPRLDNYYKFKKNYENLLIYKSFIFLEYENDINNYLKLNNLINEKNNKINYNLKMSISKIDDEILNLTNYKSKLETEEKFINNNLIIYNKLSEIEKNTLNIIVVIQIIIDKFKDYKKWLYDNYILKNLVNKTNNYIKLLCHDNCKMFELDYILTENKDIIHINWLIKNILNETNYKQIISINQASGFQNFVISMCLRLSLFGNNICNQLFIDEGFTACDKDNLSIVPNFLKNLLLIFNTITIVSHIDIIQDNIDDKIEIKYNKNTKSSNINFGYRIS